MKEMKSQNAGSANNNDDETLTDNDNRNANNETNSFPDTIISKNAQTQLLSLPEPTLSLVQIPEAQPLDTFNGNNRLVDSSEEENIESNNEKQSERIIQDTNSPTNSPTNPPSDGGKVLRWNRMHEEQRKRPRKL